MTSLRALSSQRPERMHLPHPFQHLPCARIALLLSVAFLAGLAGCGPASDNPPNLGPRANVAGTPMAQKSPPQSPASRSVPATPSASPVPFTSDPADNGNGSVSGKGIVQATDSSPATPIPLSKPPETLDSLVVPAWMAKELNSSDVGTRLRALETWVQSAPPGAIDPLILAYEDKDERVRARAMELIELDWARAAEAVN